MTIDNVVMQIAAGSQGSDADAYASKVAAASLFTSALDSAETIAAYDGAAANALAKQFIAGVTDAATLAAAISGPALTAAIQSLVAVQNTVVPVTVVLTQGIDSIAPMTARPLTGNDTVTGSALTLTSFDSIDGGAGVDTLAVSLVGAGAYAVPATATVKNIETVSIAADNGLTADISRWSGVTSLNVTALGATSLSAASGTAIHLSGAIAGAIDVAGGSAVNVSQTGATHGAIRVAGASGAVTIASSVTGAGAAGAIDVVGGSTVQVTQSFTGEATAATHGAVSVKGAATTSVVTISNGASKSGAGNNGIVITDANSGSATAAGTIKTVTAENFSTLSINDNALTALSVTGGTGAVTINNGGLSTATNKTLGLTINGQTGGALSDANVYTTLNVTTRGADSTLADINDTALTTLNVAGTKSLTLTSTAGMSQLATVTVSGSAGLIADLGAATVTTVNTAATTGTTQATIDAAHATFTGGAGVDKVTLAGATVAKPVALGAGNDLLALGGLAGVPGARLDGGAGSDTLEMSAALAASVSADATFAGAVTNFESLLLTQAGSQVIDLAALGGFNDVVTAGATAVTLNNMPTGGTLTLAGAGSAYTVANSDFASPNNDMLRVNLTDGSGKSVVFGGLTADNVENIVITLADTQATPTSPLQQFFVAGNSAKSITVSGNAGLSLAGTTDTALTSLDASAIARGGFSFASGALAGAATIKGSASGSNTVNFSAATKAVTYTGGAGMDVITAGNAQDNIVTLGDGVNFFVGGSGNNTITGGADTDMITVGGGVNTITTGAGADSVRFTAVPANFNAYSTITDAHAGLVISAVPLGKETFIANKVTLSTAATLLDYANAVIAQGGDASVNGKFGWFQFGGDTYLVESRHDGGASASYVNGTDLIVRLAGLVDLGAGDISVPGMSLALTSGGSGAITENARTAVYLARAEGATGTVSYAISGTDAALFDIDGSGAVTFKAAPDFERPLDRGNDNVYDIEVTVSAGGKKSVPMPVAITVKDVNDEAPRITSGTSASVNNGTLNTTEVYTATASDPDTTGEVLTFALSGADANKFNLDKFTGALTFRNTAEANQYAISISASDGVHTSTAVAVTITVTNQQVQDIQSIGSAELIGVHAGEGILF